VIAVRLALAVPDAAEIRALADRKVGIIAFPGDNELGFTLDWLRLLGDQVCRGCKGHADGKTEHNAFEIDAIHCLLSLFNSLFQKLNTDGPASAEPSFTRAWVPRFRGEP
jgi:hypothetical protein